MLSQQNPEPLLLGEKVTERGDIMEKPLMKIIWGVKRWIKDKGDVPKLDVSRIAHSRKNL